jgi:hypothetical protein
MPVLLRAENLSFEHEEEEDNKSSLQHDGVENDMFMELTNKRRQWMMVRYH